MEKLKSNSRIAVIAGSGNLSKAIIETLKETNQDFIVLAVKNNADESILKNTNSYTEIIQCKALKHNCYISQLIQIASLLEFVSFEVCG